MSKSKTKAYAASYPRIGVVGIGGDVEIIRRVVGKPDQVVVIKEATEEQYKLIAKFEGKNATNSSKVGASNPEGDNGQSGVKKAVSKRDNNTVRDDGDK